MRYEGEDLRNQTLLDAGILVAGSAMMLAHCTRSTDKLGIELGQPGLARIVEDFIELVQHIIAFVRCYQGLH